MVQSVNAGNLITNKYDKHFKEAVLFLPVGTDWRLLKAQCYQESRLKALAVSPVGAMGLCQFMPLTAKELQRKHVDLKDFWLPEVSIKAAGIYMAKMNKFWSAPRSQVDRYMLALASYNAGARNILKAQKLAGKGVNDYPSIIENLHKVTGTKNAAETTGYVRNILGKWYVQIIFG